MSVCMNCGAELGNDQDSCPVCGTPNPLRLYDMYNEDDEYTGEEPGPVPMGIEAISDLDADPSSEHLLVADASKVKASLALGILSIILAGPIGLVLGIVGLVKSRAILAFDPACGKAVAAKVTSIISIVLSPIATAALVMLLLYFFGGTDSATAKVAASADEVMTQLVDPDEGGRADLVNEIVGSVDPDGYIEKMGISSDDLASYLFDQASFVRTNMECNETTGTASVTYDVTSNSIGSLIDTMKQTYTEIDYSSISTMDQAYALMGNKVSAAMATATPTTKSVSFDLTRDHGEWTVTSYDMSNLAYEIYYWS